MRFRKLICTITLTLYCLVLFSQHQPGSLLKDTILIQKEVFSNFYYLNGRKVNAHVMEWLMDDIPNAHKKIKISIKLDQLSVASYSIGGISVISGLVTINENDNLSHKLLKTGVGCFGAGILFQIFNTRLERQAVEFFNREISKRPKAIGTSLKFTSSSNNLALVLKF
jgi:hypothetical protein